VWQIPLSELTNDLGSAAFTSTNAYNTNGAAAYVNGLDINRDANGSFAFNPGSSTNLPASGVSIGTGTNGQVLTVISGKAVWTNTASVPLATNVHVVSNITAFTINAGTVTASSFVGSALGLTNILAKPAVGSGLWLTTESASH
jgi:hypothetical protein